MNLLMVSPHLPVPSWGAGTRSYNLLKALAAKHSVSLLFIGDEDPGEAHRLQQEIGLQQIRQVSLQASPQRKRAHQLMSVLRNKSYLLNSYYKEEIQQVLDELCALDRYDVVIFESVFMAGYRVPAGIAVVIDQHNIEHELLYRSYKNEKVRSRRWFNWWEAHKVKPIELARCRSAQLVLVTSQREYLLLQRIAPQCRAVIVPNGVDINFFNTSQGKQKATQRIVFTGTMNYYPNIQAVLFFARECWPHIREQVPNATWQIVGKSPPPEITQLAELPGVTVTGAVPDVRPYLTAAAVAIAPLLIGSGTRLKILEALAMQKAVVSTRLGCEGLAVENGTHLLIENQPERFTQAVITLLQDADRRTFLGQAGRALVETTYSWEQCGNSLIRALENFERTEQPVQPVI